MPPLRSGLADSSTFGGIFEGVTYGLVVTRRRTPFVHVLSASGAVAARRRVSPAFMNLQGTWRQLVVIRVPSSGTRTGRFLSCLCGPDLFQNDDDSRIAVRNFIGMSESTEQESLPDVETRLDSFRTVPRYLPRGGRRGFLGSDHEDRVVVWTGRSSLSLLSPGRCSVSLRGPDASHIAAAASARRQGFPGSTAPRAIFSQWPGVNECCAHLRHVIHDVFLKTTLRDELDSTRCIATTLHGIRFFGQVP